MIITQSYFNSNNTPRPLLPHAVNLIASVEIWQARQFLCNRLSKEKPEKNQIFNLSVSLCQKLLTHIALHHPIRSAYLLYSLSDGHFNINTLHTSFLVFQCNPLLVDFNYVWQTSQMWEFGGILFFPPIIHLIHLCACRPGSINSFYCYFQKLISWFIVWEIK